MSLIVEKIKEKVDIVSLIGTYVKLEKAGKSFKGRCPFHNEKTPSFFVSPDRGAFYCFGCHAKGDVFSFIQQFEGLDFVGAIKVLADRYGIDISSFKEGSQNKTRKDYLISIMERSSIYFQRNLEKNKEALNYLDIRGLSDQTISIWNLGFAENSWRGLYDHLKESSINEEDMLSCGLIKKKEDGRVTFYDTFRGRIMFPIFDSSGRVIAFSGRIFVDDGKSAKYLNSPETEIFNKSEVLYGLDKAKYSIRERDYSILVEGQIDIIMMHQAGFTNTVASSGTALTEGHLIKLQRLSNNIIMAFDGDNAGFNAISRSAKIALSLGMEVKVAKMPEAEDPASLALKDKDALKEVIKNSSNIILFILDSILQKNSDNRIVSKKVVTDLLPFVAMVTTESEKSYFIREISQKTGLKENALLGDLKRVVLEERGVINKEEKIENKLSRVDSILRKILGLYLWQKSLVEKKIDTDNAMKVIKDLIPEEELKIVFDVLKKEEDVLIFEMETYYSTVDDLEKHFSDMVKNLSAEFLKKDLEKNMILLQKAESLKDKEEVTRLLNICHQISLKINNLNN